MSRRLDVVEAVVALATAALPGARVLGLSAADAVPARVQAGGACLIGAGDPGEPVIDLSPLAYNYAHAIPVELYAADEAELDALIVALVEAIVADRQLGGLCEWLDATSPETDNQMTTGPEGVPVASPLRTGFLTVTASYATPNPV